MRNLKIKILLQIEVQIQTIMDKKYKVTNMKKTNQER